jgi:hypothetical protein
VVGADVSAHARQRLASPDPRLVPPWDACGNPAMTSRHTRRLPRPAVHADHRFGARVAPQTARKAGLVVGRVGLEFTAARRGRCLTLTAAARLVGIRVAELVAIEDDRGSVLGERLHAALTAYARAVGLDPVEVSHRYLTAGAGDGAHEDALALFKSEAPDQV